MNLGCRNACRLIARTKDNDISQWFTERLSEIIRYRKQTLDKMSEFYDEILDSRNYIKKEQNKQSEENKIESIIKIGIYPEEWNISKICSYDRESVNDRESGI